MTNRWVWMLSIAVAAVVVSGAPEIANAKAHISKSAKGGGRSKNLAKKNVAPPSEPSPSLAAGAVSSSDATRPERTPEKPADKTADKPVSAPSVVVPASSSGMIDCTLRANETHLKCSAQTHGTVGSGPKFSGGLTTEVRHGFVSGNQLIVAVEFSGSTDDYGGIFGVDLTSGNRTLLAGKINDPVNGELTKGNSPVGKSLNQIRDVAPGPNNTWIAYVAPNTLANRTLFSINPTTGDRTVLFDAMKTPCAGIANGAEVSFDPLSCIAVGPDGGVYLALNNMPQGSGKGIAKVLNGKCSVITLSGAETAANNKGTGPLVIGSFLYNITFKDNALYMLQYNTHPSIIKIDPATGNRTLVTSAERGTGRDLATNSMTLAPDGAFWTYHAYANGFSGLVSVDPTTGNRTISEPKGGPVKRTQGPDRGVWMHPNGKNLIVQYANGLHLYDPVTGNSNVLSY